ncbi:neutral zinc metallopeptidase [Streptosporangium sp. NBC_01810]|uniref:neutral zinc metallopeptidase n=1 Tax=Streptosporangium sp. NBC_01810 TaxID=2975951 RepID=UPI002DDBD143|nr:neutral zinc metallopeptidase [Streptosporangium sp. NBC_01810]WSA25321.1 neutral zinc metallopeptidase [Streptosporangium sp. NBC_01810]
MFTAEPHAFVRVRTCQAHLGAGEAPSADRIEKALSAASAVGDDNIQERTQGRITPAGFTHETFAQRVKQRVKWCTTGYRNGDPGRCDMFSGGI